MTVNADPKTTLECLNWLQERCHSLNLLWTPELGWICRWRIGKSAVPVAYGNVKDPKIGRAILAAYVQAHKHIEGIASEQKALQAR